MLLADSYNVKSALVCSFGLGPAVCTVLICDCAKLIQKKIIILLDVSVFFLCGYITEIFIFSSIIHTHTNIYTHSTGRQTVTLISCGT